MRTPKQIERNMKGVSNHWRIAILFLVNEKKSVTLEEIVEILKVNQKTASEHTRRLMQAGLVNKQYKGRNVLHTLSPYGKTFVSFLKTLQQS